MTLKTQLVRGSNLTGLETTTGSETPEATAVMPDPDSPAAKRIRELAEKAKSEPEPAARAPVISPKRQIPRLTRGRAVDVKSSQSPTQEKAGPEFQTGIVATDQESPSSSSPKLSADATTTPDVDSKNLAAKPKPRIAPKPSPLVQKQLFVSRQSGRKVRGEEDYGVCIVKHGAWDCFHLLQLCALFGSCARLLTFLTKEEKSCLNTTCLSNTYDPLLVSPPPPQPSLPWVIQD